jgi:RimK family alpha-L-glutamate ligase
MKHPAFFVVGATKSENTKDLFEAAEKAGCDFAGASMEDLVFFYDKKKKKFQVLFEGKDICLYDIFIFRSYSKNLPEARTLAAHLASKGKLVVDEILTREYLPGKLFEASILAKNGLAHLQTLQALKKNIWAENLKKLQFPIIIKPISGSQGRDVQKIDKLEDALNFFQENPKGFLAQEYLPIDGDIRVFVVGGKALGAMKRYVVKGDVRSNASVGAKTEKIVLTKELEEIALAAVCSKGLDVAGVDIIEHAGEKYVLEINSAPQWQAFKGATGINPAKEIVAFALGKHQKMLDK